VVQPCSVYCHYLCVLQDRYNCAYMNERLRSGHIILQQRLYDECAAAELPDAPVYKTSGLGLLSIHRIRRHVEQKFHVLGPEGISKL